MNPKSLISAVSRFSEKIDPIDIVARLTLLLLLLSDWMVGDDWQFKVSLRLLALVGMLVPGVHRNRWLWVATTLLISLKTLGDWWTQDNHHFLFNYWCIALTIALFSKETAAVMASNARLLIGFSFLFAALWKGPLSDDFLHGGYFHYTFLTDRRFQDLGVVFGQLNDETYRDNYRALGRMANPSSDEDSVELQSSDRLAAFTEIIIWWTIGIETALALFFLWPFRFRLSFFRHSLLLLFAWTTYFSVPIVGSTFGWTLMILGLAQCEPRLSLTRILYIATCFLLLFYKYVPLHALLRSFLET